MKTALVITATGSKQYRDFARNLILSAQKYFVPHTSVLFTDSTEDVKGDITFLIPDLGWPDVTLYRYDRILEHYSLFEGYDYIFQIDADMLFVAPISPAEIFSKGITATVSPGYVGLAGTPDRNKESTAYTPQLHTYFCGGFVGGASKAFLQMAQVISQNTRIDASRGVTALCHDESHLNRYLETNPPAKILSPAFCCPDSQRGFYERIWKQAYGNSYVMTPKILALTKTFVCHTILPKSSKNEKVSIVIPLYNMQEHIRQCLDSALAQTYNNFEVIVVNDGSTDSSESIVRSYGDRVQLINQTNSGVSTARNNGIKNSTGAYILPLDSDDWIEKDYLSKTVPKMMDPKVGIVAVKMQYEGLYHGQPLVSPVGLTVEYEKHNNGIPTCSLIRRTAFEQTGGYTNAFMEANVAGASYEDWNLWIDILKRGWGVATVLEPLFHHRVRSNSQFTKSLLHHNELVAVIRSLHPELYRPPKPEVRNPQMKKGKVLIAIITCKKNFARIQVQQETWIPIAQEAGYDVEIFDGERLNVPDDYFSLPLKSLAFFKWAAEQDYDGVLKVDDDVYLQIWHLKLPLPFDYAGHRISASGRGVKTGTYGGCKLEHEIPDFPKEKFPHDYGSGGAIWLSKKAIQILAKASPTGDYAEDRQTGHILGEAGIEFTHSPLFYWEYYQTHKGLMPNWAIMINIDKPDQMRFLHRIAEGSKDIPLPKMPSLIQPLSRNWIRKGNEIRRVFWGDIPNVRKEE